MKSTTLSTITLQRSRWLPEGKDGEGWNLHIETNYAGAPELELVIPNRKVGEISCKTFSDLCNIASLSGNCAGIQHADAMLLQSYYGSAKIPKDWYQYKLIFPGTHWKSPLDKVFVAALVWYGWGDDSNWDRQRFGLEDKLPDRKIAFVRFR